MKKSHQHSRVSVIIFHTHRYSYQLEFFNDLIVCDKGCHLAISGLFQLFGIYLILIEFVSSVLLNLFDFMCLLAISYMYRSLPNIPLLTGVRFCLLSSQQYDACIILVKAY